MMRKLFLIYLPLVIACVAVALSATGVLQRQTQAPRHVDQDFDNFFARLEAARELRAKGDHAEAEQRLMSMLEEFADSTSVANYIVEPHFELASLYRETGRDDLAVERYSIVIDESDAPAIVVRARMELAHIQALHDEDALALLEELYGEFALQAEVAPEIAIRLCDALMEYEKFADAARVASEVLDRDLTGRMMLLDSLTEQANAALAAWADQVAAQPDATLTPGDIFFNHAMEFPDMPEHTWLWLEEAGIRYQRDGQFAKARNAFYMIARDYPGDGDSQAVVAKNRIVALARAERAAGTSATESAVRARIAAGERVVAIDKDVTESTTWSPENGTYVVIGEVGVHAPAQLTIKPGTRVEFTLHSSLLVFSRLTAGADGDETVIFTSAADTPSPFDWEGIRFIESRGSRIAGANISHARKGIVCEESEVTVASTTISKCGVTGIELRRSKALFDNVTVSGNYGIGIDFYESSGEMRDSTVTGGGKDGIIARRMSVPTIMRTEISDNSGMGIGCFDRSDVKFEDVRIERNGKAGIHAIHSAPTITDSVIAQNKGPGVLFKSNSSGSLTGSTISENHGGVRSAIVSKPSISNCTFRSNAEYGILAVTGSAPAITGNIFTDQPGPAILVRDVAQPTITGNAFSPASIAIQNEGTRPVDASANDWPEGADRADMVTGSVILDSK